MGRFGNENAYETAIDSLDNLLKNCPELKEKAGKKIEELVKELSLEAKVEHDVKAVVSQLDPVEKIRKGFQEFKAHFKKEQTLFKALAESQHPKWMIIACSDSRVDPALVLGLGLGEAFIVRNIASLVPPHSKESGHSSGASAIEYAVLHLKVEHIMIVGHSRCGGIKALLGMKEDGSNRFSEYIEDWIAIANNASKTAKAKCSHDSPFEDQWTCCVKESVNVSLWNCMSYPFVKEAVQQKKLALHGAYFDFVNGDFQRWALNYRVDEPESL
ncbi:hypothetical protein KP509_03G062800 [Ceratopteris richardii]|nr:hypothetical protein KP509_03G062800 [Ceratopteris richardii]KAH7441934.1 hypothetical protein KP509_03G062800 [Ceratopteris richardii]KAH7441936.1 hypothetical protein KP509_03G062800 [Ceratopteris richardii]